MNVPRRGYGNSKLNIPKSKRDPINIPGGPVCGKKRGPSPFFFPQPPPPCLFGSLFGQDTPWDCGKKGLNECPEAAVQQFSVCLAEKRKDTYGIQDTPEIFQGSCQGIKGPPDGGPFFPCHPPEAFLVSLRWSVTQRITGSSRKEREKSGKLRIIRRILVVVKPGKNGARYHFPFPPNSPNSSFPSFLSLPSSTLSTLW
jgi:hypothetical protein